MSVSMSEPACTAFAGTERIAAGHPAAVALACRRAVESGEGRAILVFDDATAHPVEFDARAGGSATAVSRAWNAHGESEAEPVAAAARRAPGRPRLGVVGREVTLLPRHWAWLNAQPGGASVALRKLVDQARRDVGGEQRSRRAREAAYRFMSAMAGNAPGFEEACRALFAGDAGGFEAQIASWPSDVREYASRLAAEAFEGGAA